MTDLAIVDATVITMDAGGTVHDRASVLVDGATITSIEPGPTRPIADRVIDARGGIVVPGLVNAHTHLAMTMFRGLADDVDLDGFLARLLPAEGNVLSEAAVAAGTALAVAECLRAGITTALDMYFFPEAAATVAAAAGFDLRAGPVFVEFPGADRRPFDERVEWAGDLLSATPAGRRWLCPHGTYLLDESQLATVGALAVEHDARVHVHACETAAELAAVRQRHGRSPIEVLRDTGLLGAGTVLAHGVHLTDSDLALVASSGAAVAHCPASNQKLGSGFARIPELLAAGVPVALGTDGAASANDLDLWLAMRLASYPLAARCGPGTVDADTVLRMATTGGATAAGDPAIGTIEVGTRADLVVLDVVVAVARPRVRPGVSCGVRSWPRRRAVGRGRRPGGRRRPPADDDRRRRRHRRGPSTRGADPAVNLQGAREAVHRTCVRMVADGLVIGSSGNVSVRVDEHRFVVSAAGVPYDELGPADHPVVDARTGEWEGPRRPTSEIALHRGVLGAMAEVGAVVHTHSRYAAAFSVARLDLPFICNESIATRAERVLVTEYAPPGRSISASRRCGRSGSSPAAAPCCSPTTASSPSPRPWVTPTSSPKPSSGRQRSVTTRARCSPPAPASTSSTGASARRSPATTA